MKPKKLHWDIDPVTNSSTISIRENDIEATISGNPPVSAETLTTTASLGNNVDSVQGIMGVVGMMSVVASIVSAGAPSGPVVQIIRLFKIFFRLRLINSFFGELLDYFLSQMGEMMKSSSYEFSDLDTKYFVETRGKLTEHQITIFSSFVLYDKIMIYLLLKLFSIMSSRLKRNILNPDTLTTFDFYFVKIVDSFSTVLILSGIYDFTLYCTHEILHHDMDIT